MHGLVVIEGMTLSGHPWIINEMERNFPTSTYNRKSSIVVKKTVRWIFLRSSSTYNCFNQEKNQTVCIIGPVRKKGT